MNGIFFPFKEYDFEIRFSTDEFLRIINDKYPGVK
jgi:hypothetical protein